MKLPDDKMYRDMAAAMANRVTCKKCGRSEAVDPAHCLRHGWPKCCGATMGLDKIEER